MLIWVPGASGGGHGFGVCSTSRLALTSESDFESGGTGWRWLLSERHAGVGSGSHFVGAERGVKGRSVRTVRTEKRDVGEYNVGDERRDVRLCVWRGYL